MSGIEIASFLQLPLYALFAAAPQYKAQSVAYYLLRQRDLGNEPTKLTWFYSHVFKRRLRLAVRQVKNDFSSAKWTFRKTECAKWGSKSFPRLHKMGFRVIKTAKWVLKSILRRGNRDYTVRP
jgi:hypothetical protein